MNNEKFSPTIINSKKAQDHLNKIRGEHSNLLTGIQNQSLRVQQFNQQRQLQQQEESLRQGEIDKEFRATQAAQQKESMQNDLKTKELEIKRQALLMPNDQT